MMPRMMASTSSKSVLLFMRVQQYGIDLYAEPDKNQGRGQADPSEVVDFRVEDVGVIGDSTGHQDKAQGDKGKAQKEKKVVLPLENGLSVGLLIGFVFLAHGPKVNNKDRPSSN